MKRLIVFALLLVAFEGFSQPLNYTKISNRYRWVSGMFDSALYVPRYNGTPSGVRVGENPAIDGAIAIDTANHRAYIYSGGAWVRLANYAEILAAYTAGDGLLLTGSDFKVLAKRSITIDNDSVMLVNDSTASPASYFYGTNSAGRKGWYSQSALRPYTFTNGLTESGGTVKLGGTLVDATTTIDADGKELNISDIGLFQLFTTGAFVNLSVADGLTELNGRTGSAMSTISLTDTIALSSSNWSVLSIGNRISINPYRGSLYIDSLNYTLSTTGKKIMLRDTASGLVENIDPALLSGTPGGSNKQIQYNNSSSFGGSANMTQETGQILITSTGSTNPFVVKGHEDNGQGAITEWQEHSAAAVLFSVNQDTTLSLRDFSGTVTTPAANFGKVYSRDDSLRFKNSAGTEFTLGAGGGGGITVGTTTITSGTSTRVPFNDGGVYGEDAGLTFNSGTGVLTVGATVNFSGGSSIVGQTTLFGVPGLWNQITAGQRWGIHDNGPSGAILDLQTGSYPSYDNATFYINGRTNPKQGADVASVAGAIALGRDGNTFEITGTNAITLISNVNWANGAIIYLVFTSTATLTDGTANSGTDIGMELAGNANFTGSADDVITLVLSEVGGTQRWREVSRSVN